MEKYYEEMAKFSASQDLNRLKERETGLLVLCEAKPFDPKRLYIHRFSLGDDIVRKDGWWDTFTLADEPYENVGFYICKIKDFKLDRNGFLNMIVSPMNYLGAEVDLESDAWSVFFTSGLFTNEYRSSSWHRTRYNLDSLYKLFKDEVEVIERTEKERLGDRYFTSVKTISRLYFNKYLNNEITLEEIEKALDEVGDFERLAQDLTSEARRFGSDKANKYAEDYPLLVEKLPRADKGFLKGFYTIESTMMYLTRKNNEYRELKLGNETNLLKRVEAVLQYWVNIKEIEKAERKRKRKMKKQEEKDA